LQNASGPKILATAYFNPSPLMNLQRGGWKILTASPEANGFHASSGLSSSIPSLYRSLLSRQLKKNECFEWSRPAWTFHAKGLWLSLRENWEAMAIGSSNYGHRSLTDLENQLYLITENTDLKDRMKKERQGLFEYAKPLDRLEKPALVTRLAGRLLRPFL